MVESKVYRVGPHCHGFREITRLVIFGASYCDVGYLYAKEKPDPKNPLGTSFPGVCWTENGQPNWVGHLITKHCPHPKFDPTKEEQSQEYCRHALLVYDYARGGDTVDGVEEQISYFFLPGVGKKPEWASWDSDDTLFVTWVGINDCGAVNVDLSINVKKLLELQRQLYEAGARNFLLFGIPPLHRSPAGKYGFRRERADQWNELFGSGIGSFAEVHEDSTALLFSPAETFNRLLDNPALYGFDAPGGVSMWVDHIHPASRVHDFLAADFAGFLNSVQSVLKSQEIS